MFNKPQHIHGKQTKEMDYNVEIESIYGNTRAYQS